MDFVFRNMNKNTMHYYIELRRLDMNSEIIEEVLLEYPALQKEFVYQLWLDGYVSSVFQASVQQAQKKSPNFVPGQIMDKYRRIILRTSDPQKRSNIISYLISIIKTVHPRLADDLRNGDVYSDEKETKRYKVSLP